MTPRSKRPKKEKGGKEEGAALWRRVTEDVTPLPEELANRTQDDAVDAPLNTTQAPKTPEKPAKKKKTVVRAQAPAKPATPKKDYAVAPMGLADQRKIAKGARKIDFRIDLHGMNRQEAYSALERGLGEAGENGRRRALIITGKGEGVLNRSAHDWLTTGGLKHLVSELSRAGRRHGGDGAFYATLRRTRADRKRPERLGHKK